MTAIDDLELMRIQCETLYTYDANGRMLHSNEPGDVDAPRFFLGRTTLGNEWRFRHDVPDGLKAALERASAESDDEIIKCALPVGSVWSGPAYRFPDEIAAPTNVVRLSDDNREILRPHLNGWADDPTIAQPAFGCVVDSRAVSICCSVRIGGRADEAGVETAREFRGRGYAVPAIAAWALAVRALGKIPIYSTSWDNLASQAVARRLGLVQFGTDLSIG
ncbi:MAG: GNAT family N-acetyltransferase [Gemmatimonadaceae bacterium]